MSHRWGIIPAAGLGTRIQPLAFSKELLPVGTRRDGNIERPRAVSEYLLERMLAARVDRVCFVISPAKTDIVTYFGGQIGPASICYAVQQNPSGLCDALFSALPFIAPDDQVYVGLPDTVWFPIEGYDFLPDGELSFLLFPVQRPELFDSVVTDHEGRVEQIQVKQENPASEWVWPAKSGSIQSRMSMTAYSGAPTGCPSNRSVTALMASSWYVWLPSNCSFIVAL